MQIWSAFWKIVILYLILQLITNFGNVLLNRTLFSYMKKNKLVKIDEYFVNNETTTEKWADFESLSSLLTMFSGNLSYIHAFVIGIFPLNTCIEGIKRPFLIWSRNFSQAEQKNTFLFKKCNCNSFSNPIWLENLQVLENKFISNIQTDHMICASFSLFSCSSASGPPTS